MKNKKGFTLIELLAVIVILAIIALIAVPIVLNMIENARKSAAKSSAYGYIDAINNNNELASMKNNNMENIPDTINDGTYDVTGINIKIKGKKPTSGEVTITNGRVSSATNLCFNDYPVSYNGTEATVGDKGCSGSSVSYKSYEVGEKVLFDPVKYELCDEDDSSTTCYVWIVLSKQDNKYDLYLQKSYSNMVWMQKNPVDDIKSFTATWSDKLKIDSKYDIKVNDSYSYKFSEAKARILTTEEDPRQNIVSNMECAGPPCLLINKTDQTFSQYLKNPQTESYGALIPFQGNAQGSAATGFFIHPVITLVLNDEVGNVKGTKNNTFGGTYVKATSSDTHKGIIYMNPTNLAETCNSSKAVSTTGKSTGCMKFYIYDDSGSNYKMILDHNSTAKVQWATKPDYVEAGGTDWSGSQQNKLGPVTAIKQLKKDTSGWTGSSRLINANEVAEATNTTTFTGYMDTYFFLDGQGEKKQSLSSNITKGSNHYAWLFDYTYNCETYGGCNYNDSNVKGYWTNDKNLSNHLDAWVVIYNSELDAYSIDHEQIGGIRPVITIPKSQIK